MAPFNLFNQLKAFYSKDERESAFHWLTGFNFETLQLARSFSPYSPPTQPAPQNVL